VLSASTNPVGVLFTIYYVHISHKRYYTILHALYTAYTWLVVDYTKGWFIAAAESRNRDPSPWRLLFVSSQGREGCGWATQRTRQVNESRRRDDMANCIFISVALHEKDIRRNTTDACIKFNGRYLTRILSFLMGTLRVRWIIWGLSDAGQFNLPSTCDIDVNFLCSWVCSAVWNGGFSKKSKEKFHREFTRFFQEVSIPSKSTIPA
jgi:hypothetical protein